MRYATPLFVFLLFAAGCITPASQMKPAGPAPQPMDAANRVLIRTSDEPTEAYRKVARILQREGFTLSNTDETLMSITTDWYTFKGSGWEMRVTTLVDERDGGSNITLRGRGAARIGGGTFGQSAGQEIQNSGQGGSLIRTAFQEMQRLASLYDGGEVAYARN